MMQRASDRITFISATPPSSSSSVPSASSRSIRQKAHTLRPVANPTTSSDNNKPYLQETLLYDELLRLQRSRIEDISKLQIEMEVRERKAVGFREEWRLGREEQLLLRLNEGQEREGVMSIQEREEHIQTLRNHFR